MFKLIRRMAFKNKFFNIIMFLQIIVSVFALNITMDFFDQNLILNRQVDKLYNKNVAIIQNFLIPSGEDHNSNQGVNKFEGALAKLKNVKATQQYEHFTIKNFGFINVLDGEFAKLYTPKLKKGKWLDTSNPEAQIVVANGSCKIGDVVQLGGGSAKVVGILDKNAVVFEDNNADSMMNTKGLFEINNSKDCAYMLKRDVKDKSIISVDDSERYIIFNSFITEAEMANNIAVLQQSYIVERGNNIINNDKFLAKRVYKMFFPFLILFIIIIFVGIVNMSMLNILKSKKDIFCYTICGMSAKQNNILHVMSTLLIAIFGFVVGLSCYFIFNIAEKSVEGFSLSNALISVGFFGVIILITVVLNNFYKKFLSRRKYEK